MKTILKQYTIQLIHLFPSSKPISPSNPHPHPINRLSRTCIPTQTIHINHTPQPNKPTYRKGKGRKPTLQTPSVTTYRPSTPKPDIDPIKSVAPNPTFSHVYRRTTQTRTIRASISANPCPVQFREPRSKGRNALAGIRCWFPSGCDKLYDHRLGLDHPSKHRIHLIPLDYAHDYTLLRHREAHPHPVRCLDGKSTPGGNIPRCSRGRVETECFFDDGGSVDFCGRRLAAVFGGLFLLSWLVRCYFLEGCLVCFLCTRACGVRLSS